MAGIDKLRQRTADLLGYLERNEAALVHYAARRQRGEPIATSFVESAAAFHRAYRHATQQAFLEAHEVSVKNLGQPTCPLWADQPG